MADIPNDVIKLMRRCGVKVVRKSPVERNGAAYYVGFSELYLKDNDFYMVKVTPGGEPEEISQTNYDECMSVFEEEAEYTPDETDPDYDDFDWDWENI